MINVRGDEYYSLSKLDAYNYCNKFHDQNTIDKYNKLYKIKSPYMLVSVGPGDRPCHWRPIGALCVIRDALLAGLSFPLKDFIPHLLVDVQICPCQLPPNPWKAFFVSWSCI